MVINKQTAIAGINLHPQNSIPVHQQLTLASLAAVVADFKTKLLHQSQTIEAGLPDRKAYRYCRQQAASVASP